MTLLVIVVDTFPLSAAGTRPGDRSKALTIACRQWLRDCNAAGHRLIVPAIAYYEVLREIERQNATGKIARLKTFCQAEPGRFLSITDAHLEQAAKLWGIARNAGRQTASDVALDADTILAAQVLDFVAREGIAPNGYVVATTNTKHLSWFVNAEEWQKIIP